MKIWLVLRRDHQRVNRRQGGFRGKWWKGTVRERWLVHEQGAWGWEGGGSWTLNFEDFMWAIVLGLCDPASLVEISRRVLRPLFR
jgi:hypothetical protein